LQYLFFVFVTMTFTAARDFLPLDDIFPDLGPRPAYDSSEAAHRNRIDKIRGIDKFTAAAIARGVDPATADAEARADYAASIAAFDRARADGADVKGARAAVDAYKAARDAAIAAGRPFYTGKLDIPSCLATYLFCDVKDINTQGGCCAGNICFKGDEV
ncbi:hypothetical protein BGZ95_007459, partial [Linnemannia exigua]